MTNAPFHRQAQHGRSVEAVFVIDPAIRRPEDDEASLPTVIASPVIHVPESTNLTRALTPTHPTSAAPPLSPDYRENRPVPNQATAGLGGADDPRL